MANVGTGNSAKGPGVAGASLSKQKVQSENGSATAETNLQGASGPTNFVRQIIEEDLSSGKHPHIVTRFPPEPNGFLHLGHAKSICLNFGTVKSLNDFEEAAAGANSAKFTPRHKCHLRFDDTNPCREEHRYIESIIEAVKWLGFDWGENLFYASDYFQKLYDMAEKLIRDGNAYVDDQTPEEIKATRGSIKVPGTNSPYRDISVRSIEENLRIFLEMKAGKYKDGEKVLRAKIDMTSSNMNLRDPVIYRILTTQEHPRTGSTWVIYPMYDFAHGQSDSIEKITHSVCTLEFELHRPLYDWLQEMLEIHRTRQIEFARFNCTYMIMSKRKLLTLVEQGYVKQWDDPRMPTIIGLRRRGYPPEAIRDFCDRIGVAKRETLIQIELLENCIREHMNRKCLRRYGVLNPVRVVITNYPEEQVEHFDVPNHPERPELGTRTMPFCRDLYVDRDDVSLENPPPPKYFRLALGKEVRLRYGYWVTCTKIHMKADDRKEIDFIECTYDETTKGGSPPADGRKVKGTIHWISSRHAKPAEYRMYSRLFAVPQPEKEASEEAGGLFKTAQDEEGREVPAEDLEPSGGPGWRKFISKDSLRVCEGYIEELGFKDVMNGLREEPAIHTAFQLERIGYFTADSDTSVDSGKVVMNLTVELSEMAEDDKKKQAREAREKAIEDKKKKKLEQAKKSAQ